MDDNKNSMNIIWGFNNSTGLWSLIKWQQVTGAETAGMQIDCRGQQASQVSAVTGHGPTGSPLVMTFYRIVSDIEVPKCSVGLLVTNSVELDPRETDNFSADQESLCSMEFECSLPYIYRCPSLHSILNQLNPVQTFISYFLKNQFNVILKSTPKSTKWSPSCYI
jgi:hypothetical protein